MGAIKHVFYKSIRLVIINLFCYFCYSSAAKGNVIRLKSYASAGADPITAKDMWGRTPLHAVRSKFIFVSFPYCIMTVDRL